ncbi:MAG: hypothetical protein OHK0018_14940 [Erythrobacter tepidarius]
MRLLAHFEHTHGFSSSRRSRPEPNARQTRIMANTPQAKKRIRRNAARAKINGARLSRIRSFIKKVESA